MKNKEIMKLKNEIKDLEDLAKFKTGVIRELQDKLKAKEQECERLKADVERWKSNFNGKVTAIKELLQQLDQLKAKNEELKRRLEVKGNILKLTDEAKNEYSKENKKLKQTLAEIKEIIHFNKTNRLSGGACISIEQILQKINEYEGDNEI